jgi:hypothetical protein
MNELHNIRQAVTGQGGPVSAQLPPLTLPPTFPPGVDPTTYKLKEVEYILNQSAFINMFATSIPAKTDVPVPVPGSASPSLLGGLCVFRQLQRFYINIVPSSTGIGLRASNTVGQSRANLTFQLALMPDDFYAAPGRVPPLTPLDLQRSQRFTMLESTFTFDEEGQHRFHGFGSGRTFPVRVGGTTQVYLGAIGNIMKGFGTFEGAIGAYVINGYLTPPYNLSFQILLRIVTPSSDIVSSSELSSLEMLPDPARDSTYMTLLGGADPDNPLQQHFGPNGQLQGATVHELLRSIQLDFDQERSGTRLRTYKTVGPVVAKLHTELRFNPFDPQTPGTALSPIPWGTQDTAITFLNSQGETTGTLEANIIEGRGFLTDMAGAPMPVFRLLGYGPFVKGTGQLAGVDGMFSVNAFISVLPGAFSNLYVFRFVDPDRKFRIN